MSILDNSKSIIENIYFLSGIFITIISLFGLYNIVLLKKANKKANKDVLNKYTLDKIEFFCEILIPLYDNYMKICREKKIKRVDVGITELELNQEYFIKTYDQEKYDYEYGLRKEYEEQYRQILNKIELIAITFEKEFADIELGRKIIGEIFCKVVEEMSFEFLTQNINSNLNNFENTILIYNKWKKL